MHPSAATSIQGEARSARLDTTLDAFLRFYDKP
jgi:hypothetical protein